VKFRRIRSERIVRVQRQRGSRIEFRMFQVGAAITVPQTLQVRWSRFEKNRWNTLGNCVSMSLTGTRSR
jgi:hypothetical protein